MNAGRTQVAGQPAQGGNAAGPQATARADPGAFLGDLAARAGSSAATAYLAGIAQRAKAFGGDRTVQGKVVQRVRDLNTIYAADKYNVNPQSGADDKAEWLSLFRRAQDILRDGDNLREALRQLSSEMAQTGRTLARSLAMHLNAEDQRRVFLTGFVPPAAFTRLVREELYLFEDFVRQGHGVYSHQLQFYILLHNMGETAANLIRREALNSRWNASVGIGAATMWDNIVDGVNANVDKLDDLTVPNNVTKYVIETLREEQGAEARAAASDEVARSFDEHGEDRDRIRARYPSPDTLRGALKAAQKRLRKLEKRRGTSKEKDTDRDEAVQLEESIIHEVQVNTTTVGGQKMTIEWTGWIRKNEQSVIWLEPTIGKVV
ncbi:hypothetical protein [uncultured Roseobacter sp.]|uniref:hypothetical protein n=1 Tax=uncultured Roseobacter sp. TaxID=114847 RepID=UPI00262A178C|nr:hypothetical protein [uncultured Roseobacter sp.]